MLANRVCRVGQALKLETSPDLRQEKETRQKDQTPDSCHQ